MNFIALDEKARKALFKLATEKDIKLIAKKNKNEKQYLLRFKKNIERGTHLTHCRVWLISITIEISKNI